eukprot:TRINITY_DN1420_c0_g2_i1.p1 TRINITY_DN1420_c0_g2~~TRINITY_DN1420_c0_g2_i1.p1  ORF type:complete len:250 (-),score=106.51 TRINITY_DN1420_c0_g2_i1:118-867(-)
MATKKSATPSTRDFYNQFQTTSKFIKPEAKAAADPAPAPAPAPVPSANPPPPVPSPATKTLPPAFSGQAKPKPAEPKKPGPPKKPDSGANYTFPTLRNNMPSQAGKRGFWEQQAAPGAAPGAGAAAPKSAAAAPKPAAGKPAEPAAASKEGIHDCEENERLLAQLMEEEEALEKEIVELHELLKASLDETDSLVGQLQTSDEKLTKNKKLLKEVLDLAKKMISANGEEKANLEKKFVSTYLRTATKAKT